MIQKLKIALLASVMLLIGGVAKADDASSGVTAFLEKVYKHYESGATPLDAQGKDADWLFEPSLLKLIRDDEADAKAKSEVPVLDGDPICDCQEHNIIKNVQISVLPMSHDKAAATIAFSDGPADVKLQYILARIDGSWKIQDIANADNGSLRDTLIKGLQESKDGTTSDKLEIKSEDNSEEK
jgi:hypothetical protein